MPPPQLPTDRFLQELTRAAVAADDDDYDDSPGEIYDRGLVLA
ncbi:hypothetical protein GEV33_012726 [Tenebrio molitor]|jgi:hypothetical protein|uniref:Uncharacterized protein n=1 Tax=Tenebrio molitor TaxID=7067 RepID=A0A8J6L7Y3_TENMO|nr:hypothetical protein GEV33_012726 [Tenebrio molitor]